MTSASTLMMIMRQYNSKKSFHILNVKLSHFKRQAITKQFAVALPLLMPFAQQGHKIAQHLCAMMYQYGLAGERNPQQAFELMQASAAQGYGLAQHALGFMYLEGNCTTQDSQQAAYWLQQASEQGLQGALVTLALMYKQGNGVAKNENEAKRLYQLAGFSGSD